MANNQKFLTGIIKKYSTNQYNKLSPESQSTSHKFKYTFKLNVFQGGDFLSFKPHDILIALIYMSTVRDSYSLGYI